MENTFLSSIEQFRQLILAWGDQNPRQYPWRYQSDPYRVLVSEFMLHRTQTRQVIPVYLNFLEKYPSLAAFSIADPHQVSESLQSLGLGWRIIGMVNALTKLWELYQKVPIDLELLQQIRGIGQYIAGAVVCYTRNEPVPLIDTNIVRVVGRVYGLSLAGEARRRRSMIDAITDLVDPERPRDYHYSIIDLAHTICRPSNPACNTCPLSGLPCKYLLDNPEK